MTQLPNPIELHGDRAVKAPSTFWQTSDGEDLAKQYAPDLEQAQAFLDLLDEFGEFTFQTFDDDKERLEAVKQSQRDRGVKPHDPMAKIMHGTLDEHAPELARLNAQGAGVFVTINETDLKGRTKGNITAIRGLYGDADEPEGASTRIARIMGAVGIEPTVVVESSPDKHHMHWLCNGLGLDEAEPLLQALIRAIGCDPKVSGKQSVLRLPGFYHRKGEPFLVRIIHEGERTTPEALRAALAPYAAENRPEGPQEPRQQQTKGMAGGDIEYALEGFHATVNRTAIRNYPVWVPVMFPTATPYQGGYRVASADLGRNLEEDLTFHPKGIKDFGTGPGLTAIDAVQQHCPELRAQQSPHAAAFWLCDRMGIDPEALGWQSRPGDALAQWRGEPSQQGAAATPPSPEEVAAALDALEIPEPERPGAFAIPESCTRTFAGQIGLDVARATEMPEATAVLTALGALSGVFSMAFTTGYPDGQRLPLGLYTVAEQPPATAKSRLLNTFVKPWLRKVQRYNAEQIEKAEEEAEQDGDEKPKKPRLLPLPFSNATPEAMEQAMTIDDTGHFWLQSAEQGAIRMLFGDGMKDRPKNFDLALKGFNGEFHSSARVTRQKLLKEVYGAITVLAQAGSIRTILNNSDGDGLAERFLCVAEPHNLGRRTHRTAPPDAFLAADLESALEATIRHYQTIPEDRRGELDDLHYLGFSSNARETIRQHKIRLEPKLAQHADNGEMVMTAILGKTDMQAMKLAAVMYLSDCLSEGKPYSAEVPDEYLLAGLELAMTLAKHVEAVLMSMERIGPEAAREAVRRQFDKRSERTVRELVQNLKKVKPFRDNPTPNAYAKRIITGMVNRGELLQVGNKLHLG